MNTFKQYGFWAILGLTALAFFAAGVGKLLSVEMLHQSFATLGLPLAFGYFIGFCEVSGAIGLFIKKFSALAALGLSIIMVGAMYYHLAYDPKGFIPAAVLFIFSIVIFIKRKKDSLVFAQQKAI